jgi:hypothetical protein
MRDRNLFGVARSLNVAATTGPWQALPAGIRSAEICGVNAAVTFAGDDLRSQQHVTRPLSQTELKSAQIIAALRLPRNQTVPIKDL